MQTVLAMLTLLFALDASAQEYLVIGRGIADRKTGDSIALACTENGSGGGLAQCREVRHLFVDGKTREARFIGPAYPLNAVTTDQDAEIKTLLKNIHQEFKKQKKKGAPIDKGGLIALGGASGLCASFYIIGIPAMTAALSGPIGVTVMVGAGFFLAWSRSDQGIRYQAGHVSSVYLDRNGWNWSDEPERKGHRKFNRYYEFVTTGTVQDAPTIQ